MREAIWTGAKDLARLVLGRRYSEELSWRIQAHRLARFANRHQGERCFIIGNGPSLNRMDLRPLAREITFGLNRIYLLFDKIGFATTYYVSVNMLVLEQCAAEIQNLDTTRFIGWDARRWFRARPDLLFIRSIGNLGTPFFMRDIRQGVWEGATVTYVAMQIAYYMGFKRVILIGVDHNFVTTGLPHSIVVSEGADRDHFVPDYFGKGFRWQLPDLQTSELAYRLARGQFESSGREILDATVKGKLDVFPKVSFENCLNV
ncbi:MAG: 6-hydroxymethylpterin diphosphokinase MptE-like protein [Candidatus Hodarchaeota archaeon]